MIFAIEEINRSGSLLPNVSIGYRIYDTCGSRLSTMSATIGVMNGQDFGPGDTCNGQPPLHAIIGESESSATVILSRTTGPFKIPVLSPSATCECLSNRKDYPSFFRTIASDYHQSRALAYIVKYFGWSWVGAVNSDNDYGNNGMAVFLKIAQEEGICIEYSVKFYRTETEKLKKVVDTIKKGTAKVIVAFVSFVEMGLLIDQLSIHNIAGFQIIGVESWITTKNYITPNSFHSLGGSLGFAVRKINIEGFTDYVIKEFWDTIFPCSQSVGNSSQYALNCSRYEDLFALKNYNEDVPEQRYASNVYKAVYAVAHSLHSLLKCKEQEGCEKRLTIQPQEVVEALKSVNFTIKMGDHVWFDSTGGAVAQYEVVNWQKDSDGSFQFKSVGYYDASLPPLQRLVLNTKNIIWARGQLKQSIAMKRCKMNQSRKRLTQFGISSFLINPPQSRFMELRADRQSDGRPGEYTGIYPQSPILSEGRRRVKRWAGGLKTRDQKGDHKGTGHSGGHGGNSGVSSGRRSKGVDAGGHSGVDNHKSTRVKMVEAMKKVNFTTKMGDHVWFDSSGGAVAQYEVVNWQQDSDGSFQFKSVGYYDASLPPHQRLQLDTKKIIWAGGLLEVNVNNLLL
ncbi:extracellular calcium-sensing receptor-like protein [Labeo rohita]|uniref:Extracellular calcium-sensing receptor-like protein n=1 Tax=Labeo rohita TaxID=84645 RepID=A0A498NLZ6_LABRO|nr:extracellular calcium-sensing receptor-like protein [Labeo rohita]